MKAHKSFKFRNRSVAKRKLRLLVADADFTFSRRLSEYLNENGFEARVAGSVERVRDLLEVWEPDILFLDALLPNTNTSNMLKFVTSALHRKVPRIILMSRVPFAQGAEPLRRAGVSIQLTKPFSLEDAFRAVAQAHERHFKEPTPIKEQQSHAQTALGPEAIKELHLVNLFLRQAMHSSKKDLDQNLYNLMRMINLKARAVRTSTIQFMGGHRGRVLASNDNERIRDFRLDLRKYPELLELQRTQSPVVIPNVRLSPMMAMVHEQMAGTAFESIVLFPLFRNGTLFGALSVRMHQCEPVDIFYVEKFGQVCSQIMSLAIGAPGQQLINDRF